MATTGPAPRDRNISPGEDRKGSAMTKVAAVVAFKAKPGYGGEVARLIAAALPSVQAEAATEIWLVLRSDADEDTVFLVDIFSDAAGRDEHMAGEAAKLIFATVPPHLAGDPAIHPCEVIVQHER